MRVPDLETATTGNRPTRASRFITHLRDPLYRNGYALVASSAITSVLGLLFWLIAARRFTVEVIGISSATISAMILLANLGQLNLVNALNRFVPRAGPATVRLIVGSYAVAAALGGIAASVFLVGIEFWSPGLTGLTDRGRLGIWFIVATMGWAIFVLQDGALTGLRRATYVTIENFVYAIAKLGLLFLPLVVVDDFAVFLAWTIPLLPILAVVNTAMFGRVIPTHAASQDHDAQSTTVRTVARFASVDYFASLIWTATVNVLPLIVLRIAGAEANGYFYLAWSVAYSLQLVSRYMGMSFVTEASMDRPRLFTLAYRTTVQTYVLVIPAVIVIVVGAPLILRLFGPTYAAEGGAVLRLLAVAAVPATLNVIYMAVLRVERRMGTLLGMTSATAAITIPASLLLLPSMGVTGVGVAWLGAQSLVALVVGATRFRPIWAAGFATPAGRRFSDVVSTMRRRSRETGVDTDMRAVLGLGPEGRVETASTVGDVAVAIDEPGRRVARLARSTQGDAAVLANGEALVWWKHLPEGRVPDLVVPTLVGSGDHGGRAYSIETLLPGVGLDSLGESRPSLVEIAQPVAQMHAATSHERLVDDPLIIQVVVCPLRRLAANAGPSRSSALQALRTELTSLLDNRSVTLARIHGDYTPRNILIDPVSLRITGIVDWERSHSVSLPDIDIIALLLSDRAGGLRELGDVVVEAATETHWRQDEEALLAMSPNRDSLGQRGLVLLAWLHHIESNLGKSTRFGRNWVWTARNIDHVIDHV